MNSAIHAAGLWSGVSVILLLVLSGLTSANRRKHRVSIGDGGNASVAAASRAFGNAAEYIPIALIALGLLALSGFPVWSIHLIGGAFVLGRILHAVGMFRTVAGQQPRIERMAGMLLTYLPLLASAVMLVGCWICAIKT